MNYFYPIEENWTTEEIIKVLHFFESVEKAYESQIKREDLLQAYRGFKHVVPSKSEEKRLFRQFKQASNYESYYPVQRARNSQEAFIKLKREK